MSKSVFKIINENCEKNRVTVGDTNFKKHYPAIHKSMSWATLEPLIRQATEKYVYPYICEDAFCDLADKFEAGVLSPTTYKAYTNS